MAGDGMEEGRRGWGCTVIPINLDLGLYEYMYPARSWFGVLTRDRKRKLEHFASHDRRAPNKNSSLSFRIVLILLFSSPT